MNPTDNLLGVLQNVRSQQPVLESSDSRDGEVTLKFRPTTTKVKAGNDFSFYYIVSEKDAGRIDWVKINKEMGYIVHKVLDEDDFIFFVNS